MSKKQPAGGLGATSSAVLAPCPRASGAKPSRWLSWVLLALVLGGCTSWPDPDAHPEPGRDTGGSGPADTGPQPSDGGSPPRDQGGGEDGAGRDLGPAPDLASGDDLAVSDGGAPHDLTPVDQGGADPDLTPADQGGAGPDLTPADQGGADPDLTPADQGVPADLADRDFGSGDLGPVEDGSSPLPDGQVGDLFPVTDLGPLADATEPRDAADAGALGPVLDPSRCTVHVQPAAGVLADGLAEAVITVRLFDLEGRPVAGEAVRLVVSGTGNRLDPAAGSSDPSGTFVGRLASTRAERKQVGALVGPGAAAVSLPAVAEVDFVAGPAAELVVVDFPAEALAGEPFVLTVAALDASGNPVSLADRPVFVSLVAGPPGASLYGRNAVLDPAGTVSFPELMLTVAGEGYVLEVRAFGLPALTMPPLSILPNAPQTLRFLTQPGAVRAGQPFDPPVELEVLDAHGNPTDGDQPVRLSLLGRPVDGTGLLGTWELLPVDGRARFGDLRPTLAGAAQVLQADCLGLPTTHSAPFSVLPGDPQTLVFVVQPTDVDVGSAITPAPRVEARDEYGNRSPGNGLLTVQLALSGGPAGAELLGSLAAPLRDDAVFAGLQVSTAGAGYRLVATAEGLTAALSDAFSVRTAELRLVLGELPASLPAGASFDLTVALVGEDGLPVLGRDRAVTLSLEGPGGLYPFPPGPRPTQGGTVTFRSLVIRVAGEGYRFRATATDAAPAQSDPFSVLPGPASSLACLDIPASVQSGEIFLMNVDVLDAWGNRCSGPETVKLTPGACSGVLAGTFQRMGAPPISFDDLSLTGGEGGSCTVLAGLVGTAITASCPAIRISAPPSCGLRFASLPAVVTAGHPLPVEIAVLDDSGEVLSEQEAVVQIALAEGPPGAILHGSLATLTVDGLAQFDDLHLEQAGSYRLVATSGECTAATSASFEVLPDAIARLALDSFTPEVEAGLPPASPFVVRLVDRFGNTVPQPPQELQLSLEGPAVRGSGLGTRTTSLGGLVLDDLIVHELAEGLVLRVEAAGLPPLLSPPFASVLPAGARLAYTSAPQVARAGLPLSPEVALLLLDPLNRTVLLDGLTVSLALAGGPADALLGPTTASTVDGAVSFAGLAVTAVGRVQIVATAPELAPVGSSFFTVQAGVPVALGFVSFPPEARTCEKLYPYPVVGLYDAWGHQHTEVVDPPIPLVVTLGEHPAGATLGGTTSTQINVVATVTLGNLVLSMPGRTSLVVSSPGLAAALSPAFTVQLGAPSALHFRTPLTEVWAGEPLPTSRVTAEDCAGNIVTDFVGNVTVSLQYDSSNSLAGTLQRPLVAGVALFDDLQVRRIDDDWRLVATASGIGAGTSEPFRVVPGPAASYASWLSGSVKAGVPFTASVRVSDAFGNPAPDGLPVTVSLVEGPAAAVLSGTLEQAVQFGTARFPDLVLDRAGEGYVLRFQASGGGSGDGAPFAVQPGSPATVRFKVQPGDTAPGAILLPAVELEVLDQGGALATNAFGTLELRLAGPPPGVILSGGTGRLVQQGVASFGALSVNKPGAGFALVARYVDSAGGYALEATSARFDVGEAASLVFLDQPSCAIAGSRLVPDLRVELRTADGQPFRGATVPVSMSLEADPGELSGTLLVSAVDGIATFSDLRLATAGKTSRLVATAASLASATSQPITPAAGAAERLGFLVQPGSIDAGQGFSPPVQVAVLDGCGGRLPVDGVDVTILSTAGVPKLLGPVTATSVAGVASFPELRVEQSCSDRTLSATAVGLTAAQSSLFSVAALAASRLRFESVPLDPLVGAILGGQGGVYAGAVDRYGNPAAPAAPVDVTIGLLPAGAGLLEGTLVKTLATPALRFADLVVRTPGDRYTLQLTAPGLEAAESLPFRVLDPTVPVGMVFASYPPGGRLAGDSLGPVRVQLINGQGQPATDYDGAVLLELAAGPAGAQLAGDLAVLAVDGVASFAAPFTTTAGEGFQLRARVPDGTLLVTGPAFRVDPAAAVRLGFEVQPPAQVSAGAFLAPAPTVAVQDRFGNLVSSPSFTVTLGLGANPVGGHLSGGSAGAIVGRKSYPNLSLDLAGPGYTLRAAAPGLEAAESTGIQVVAGASERLVFAAPVGNGVYGTSLSPVQVVAHDHHGNPTALTGTEVTIGLRTEPVGGTLAGTLTRSLVDGRVEFSDLVTSQPGTAWLSASAPGLTPAAGNAFLQWELPPQRMDFVAAPTTAIAGEPLAPPVEVRLLDVNDRETTHVFVQIQVTPARDFPAFKELGAQPVNVVGASRAVFPGLVPATAGEYRLWAWNPPGTMLPEPEAFSPLFTVLPAEVDPARATVQVEPETVVADGVSAAAIEVVLQDALGNPVPDALVLLEASGDGNSLEQPVATDPQGWAGGTLRSTVAGEKTVTVRVVVDGVSQLLPVQPRIHFVADVADLSATLSSLTLLPGADPHVAGWTDPAEVLVTIRDAQGNPVPERQVVLLASGMDFRIAQPELTLLDGTARGRLFGLQVGQHEIRARVQQEAGWLELVARATVRFADVSPVITGLHAAPGELAGCAPLSWTLTQAGALPVDLRVEFAPGPDASFRPASTATGARLGQGTQGLPSSAAGVSGTFVWATDRDLWDQRVEGVRLRITPLLRGQAGAAQALDGLVVDNRLRHDPREDLVVSGLPDDLLLVDLDRDSWADLVTTSRGDGSLTVRLGLPAGGWGAPVRIPLPVGPVALATGDLDRDGVPDLVGAAEVEGRVAFLQGKADGTFEPAVLFAAGPGTQRVAVADLDRDGKVDVLSLDRDGASCSFFRGDGQGGLASRITLTVCAQPRDMLVQDLDEDGTLDLLVACGTEASVRFLAGDGAGGFALRRSFPTAAGPRRLRLADVDHDQRPDLLVLQGGGGSVGVLIADGPGSFGARRDVAVGLAPAGLEVADLDGDGDPDLVVGLEDGRRLRIFLGDGQGGFAEGSSSELAAGPYTAALAPTGELLVAQRGASSVGVLRSFRRPRCSPVVLEPPLVPNRNHTVLALADLDGDGRPDDYTTSGDAYAGQGNGVLGQAAPHLAGFGRQGAGLDVSSVAALAQVDADPWPDVVEGSYDPIRATGSLRYHRGGPDGSFVQDWGVGFSASYVWPDEPLFALEPQALALGELDGDGVLDALVGFGPGRGMVRVPLGPRRREVPFYRPEQLLTTGGVVDVAVADLDGDRQPDLLAVLQDDDELAVLRGTGPGEFDPPVRYAVGPAPASLALGDLDEDGLLDVVVASGDGSVSLLGNDGEGGLASLDTLELEEDPLSVLLVDVDGDRHLDLVTGNGPRVFFGDGQGALVEAELPVAASGWRATRLLHADLDGDGIHDLVGSVGGPDLRLGSWFEGEWFGTLPPDSRLLISEPGSLWELPEYVAADAIPAWYPHQSPAGPDLDRDGVPDRVRSYQDEETCEVWLVVELGTRSGTFVPAYTAALTSPMPKTPWDKEYNPPYHASGGEVRAQAVDLDRDGVLDLVVAVHKPNYSSNPSMAIMWTYDTYGTLRGRGDGTFEDYRLLETVLRPTVHPVDVNRDGILDLVAADDPPFDGYFIDQEMFALWKGSDLVTPAQTVVRLGRGDGTFAVSQRLSFHLKSVSDRDRDGDLDCQGWLRFQVGEGLSRPFLLNDGSGRFSVVDELPEFQRPVPRGDEDGDGIPEGDFEGASGRAGRCDANSGRSWDLDRDGRLDCLSSASCAGGCWVGWGR